MLSIGSPVLATVPGLELPDGHGCLNCVDTEASRRERLTAMGGGRDYHYGSLADRDRTDPVQQRDSGDCRPSPTCLVSHSKEPGFCLLLVGLVHEPGHVSATLGVVPCISAEQHDGTTVGSTRPPESLLNRERFLS